jgi:hypothetical protein
LAIVGYEKRRFTVGRGFFGFQIFLRQRTKRAA